MKTYSEELATKNSTIIALNDEIKVYVVRSTDTTNEALKRHDIWPSAASVLGKAMTIALMIGGNSTDINAI